MATWGGADGWWTHWKGRVQALTKREPRGTDDRRFIEALLWVVRTGAPWRDLGRSRGGFSTKLHALVSEHGRLVRYLLTGGEVNDITQAKALVSKDVDGRGVVGDRAYDSNEFALHLEELTLEVVIPSRANRVAPRSIDTEVYRRRDVFERWFGRLKQFRRIATRYDKTQSSFGGFIALGASQVAWSGWEA